MNRIYLKKIPSQKAILRNKLDGNINLIIEDFKDSYIKLINNYEYKSQDKLINTIKQTYRSKGHAKGDATYDREDLIPLRDLDNFKDIVKKFESSINNYSST